VLILRLLPLAFMAAALTACTSVHSAPPSASSQMATNAPPAWTANAPGLAQPQGLPVVNPAPIDSPAAPSPMTMKSSVNASDKPYSYKETIVSRKINQLRGDKDKVENYYRNYASRLKELQSKSENTAQQYYSTIASINSRLQAGTTAGNPILVEQSQVAQSKLESISGDINTLSGLANDVSSNASIASYLLEAVRATYGLSGAVDEDHVALTQLEDEVNRLVVQIDRQLTDVNNDINRRTAYLATERRNLQTLTLAIANGELYGSSIANRAFFSPTTAMPGDPDLMNAKMGKPANFNTSKPLVMIRFDRPKVDFEQAVYTATSEALQNYPDVSFEVLAVSPQGRTATKAALAASDAQTDAQNVVRSMIQMGIPGNRIKVSSAKSPQAQTPEVHIFLR